MQTPFAEQFGQLRQRARLNQSELADAVTKNGRIRLTQAAVSAIDGGTIPRDRTFEELCAVLGPRASQDEPVRPLPQADRIAWWLLRLEPASTR